MESFKNIKAIIFDLGGVLLDLDRDRCIRNFHSLGVNGIEKFLNDYLPAGFLLQLEKGKISPEEFRNEIRKFTPQKLTDEQIDEAFCSFLVDIPSGRLQLLLDLRKRFKLYLLSNTNAIHMDYCKKNFFQWKGHQLEDFFDKCFFSYELGLTKPDPEIFKVVLQEAKLQPHECLFLDDGIINIEEASKLGIQTHLVKEGEDLNFLLQPSTFIFEPLTVETKH